MSFPYRAGVEEENTDRTVSGRAVREEPAAVPPIAPVRDSPDAATDHTLARCHELIRELQRENVRLRRSGEFFGQLAERLNHQLRQQRTMLPHDTARPWASDGDDCQRPPRQGLLE
ncbi:MAG: hypothetical protein V7647_3657 [Acidobacteriota bacterium]|jgi:hypothetical protein